MGEPNQQFDRQLFVLKLSGLSQEMQGKGVESDRAAQTNEGNPYFPDTWSRSSGEPSLIRMVNGQLALLREWLEGVDRICREVWQIQGKAVTAEFVRDVLLPEALTLMEARKGSVMGDISRRALRIRAENTHPAQRHLTMEINKLKGEVNTRYEIEARTLKHKQTHKPKIKLPEPIKPLNTSWGGGPRDTSEAEHRAKPEASTERADQSVLPPGLCGVGDPVDGNPFPRENPRYAHWQQATLKAEEELCLLNAQFMKNSLSSESFAEWMQRGGPYSTEREFAAWMLNFVAARFDIWAKRACHVVWDEHDLKVFDKWLFDYAESWLRAERDAGRDAILRELRARLIERMEYWKAAARGTLSELRRVEAENSGKTGQAVESKRTGRPRKDAEREVVRALKANGESWKDIAATVNAQTGQNKGPEAYRSLLKSRSVAGKNGQK